MLRPAGVRVVCRPLAVLAVCIAFGPACGAPTPPLSGSISDGGGEADAGPSDGGDAGLSLDGGPQVNGDPLVEKADLTQIAKAMLNFHTDTGGWPFGATAWYAVRPPWRTASDIEIDGTPFTSFDTALFAQPPDIVPCDATQTGGYTNPCWKGPYLPGATTDSLGAGVWVDRWGNPRMYGYIRPNDGMGGGIDLPGAEMGLIFIWSKGKDGVDGFMCTTANGQSVCELNLQQLVMGLPSEPGADDIIKLVASSSE